MRRVRSLDRCSSHHSLARKSESDGRLIEERDGKSCAIGLDEAILVVTLPDRYALSMSHIRRGADRDVKNSFFRNSPHSPR